MTTLVIEKCRVEITLPEIDVESMSLRDGGSARISLIARDLVDNMVVRCDGHLLRVGRLLLEKITGKILPVMSPDGKSVLWYAFEDEAKPDAVR